MNAHLLLNSIFWKTVLVLCVAGSAILIPFHLVSTIPDARLDVELEVLLSAVFFLDFFLRCRHFFQLSTEERSTKTKVALVFDFIAAIPWRLIFGLAILDLPRLCKLFRLFPILRVEKEYSLLWNNILQLSIVVFWIGLFIHWLACGWVALHAGSEEYLRALYWAVTTLTTVGYGDVTPSNTSQTIYTMIVMFLGVGVYGYIIGNVTNILTKVDLLESQHNNKMEGLNGFLKYRQVSPVLQQRINEFYNYLWNNRMDFDENQLLSDLPSSLQRELSFELKQGLLEKVPFLQNADEKMLADLISMLQPQIYTPQDIIFHKGDSGDKMYFIGKGEIELFIPETQESLAFLKEGEFFGEVALLKNTPRMASARTNTYCDLYVLNKLQFDTVLEEYPAFARHIIEVAGQRHSISQEPIQVGYDSMDRIVLVEDASKTLLELSVLNMIPHIQDCGGHGVCTTCRVSILDGLENVSPRTEKEERIKKERGWDKSIRLACQAKVFGNVRLRRAVQNASQLGQLQLETSALTKGDTQKLIVLTCLVVSKKTEQPAKHLVQQRNELNDIIGEIIIMNGGLAKTGIYGEYIGVFGINSSQKQNTIQAVLRCIHWIQRLVQDKKNLLEGHCLSVRVEQEDFVIGSIGHKEIQRTVLLRSNPLQWFHKWSSDEYTTIQVTENIQQQFEQESHEASALEQLQECLDILIFQEDKFLHQLQEGIDCTDASQQYRDALPIAATQLLKRLLYGLGNPQHISKLLNSLVRQYALYNIKEKDVVRIIQQSNEIIQTERKNSKQKTILQSFLQGYSEVLLGKKPTSLLLEE